MPTLLIFGPRLADGNRDSYLVEEDLDTVAAACEASSFVRLTDPADGQAVVFRTQSIRYMWAE